MRVASVFSAPKTIPETRIHTYHQLKILLDQAHVDKKKASLPFDHIYCCGICWRDRGAFHQQRTKGKIRDTCVPRGDRASHPAASETE